MAGPALLLFGTTEQKRRFLPLIASGKIILWQLFTEPDAGSDEANVRLRATADGDTFVLNDQKMFVGETYKPDYLYTLARTADTTPKHKGLTLFLVPADTPGITYRPLTVISGQQKNEVFFDSASVSGEYLLGELNRGFYHAMATLEFERSNTGMAAGARRNLEEYVDFCKKTKRHGRRLIDDPQVRDTLVKILMEIEVWSLAGWRTAWRFSERDSLGALDYDLNGYYRRLFSDRHCSAMMKAMGLFGQLRTGSKWVQLGGAVHRKWLRTRSLHAGGTIEMVKVVLSRERAVFRTRRGKLWSRNAVNGMLQNEVYTGVLAWTGKNGRVVRIEDAHTRY